MGIIWFYLQISYVLLRQFIRKTYHCVAIFSITMIWTRRVKPVIGIWDIRFWYISNTRYLKLVLNVEYIWVIDLWLLIPTTRWLLTPCLKLLYHDEDDHMTQVTELASLSSFVNAHDSLISNLKQIQVFYFESYWVKWSKTIELTLLHCQIMSCDS